MIQMPLEDVISKIKDKTGLTEQDINDKINDKLNQLAGLISKEGAAHIIANELGVKIFDATSGKLKINKILAGMRNVEVVGRVVNVFEVRQFNTGQRSGSVGSFILGDETGSMRCVLWNDQTKAMAEFKEGQVVKIVDAYVKDNQGRKELHLGDNAKLQIDPQGETVGEYEVPKAVRKKISELADDDNNVELLGTIVQVFEPRFFEVCPRCRKRVRQKDQGWVCDVHGVVDPKFSYVITMFVDDGTDNIRGVFFNAQTQSLLDKSDEEVNVFRTAPETFEQVKYDLLGKIIMVEGRVNKNVMFDRKEFIVQRVNIHVDAKGEVKRLKEETPAQVPGEPAVKTEPVAPESVKSESVAPTVKSESVESEAPTVKSEPVAPESVTPVKSEVAPESVAPVKSEVAPESVAPVKSEVAPESVAPVQSAPEKPEAKPEMEPPMDFFNEKKEEVKKEPSVVDEDGNEVPVPKETKKDLPKLDDL